MTSCFQLPPELLSWTISFLASDKSSISACSLVSKSWLSAARYHSLHPNYTILKLEDKHISRFLDLLKSPHTSLHLLPATELHLRQQRTPIRKSDYIDNFTERSCKRTKSPCRNSCCVTGVRNWAWKKDTNMSDFFCWKSQDGRSFPALFPAIGSLHIEWVDWQTLPPSALASLRSDYSYSNITSLKLNDVTFQSLDDLVHIICAIPSLCTLHLLENVQFRRPWFDRPNEISECHRLKSIHLDSPSTPVMDAVSRIQYHSALSSIDISLPRHFQLEILQKCEALINAAGPNLSSLKLVGKRLVKFTEKDWVILYRLLALNPNLQELHLNMVLEIHIVDFLQNHLPPSVTQNIHTLHFRFLGLTRLESIPRLQVDWKALDKILSDTARFPKLQTLMFAMAEYAYCVIAGDGWEDEQCEREAECKAAVEVAKQLPETARRMDIFIRKF
ncbi:hypothetical protein VKT23_015631 [Stygiomarasmius scandens]|uniref:F-box domain-containing protein n=1 Tax=Marasmiellus scandens TaxID=2682957 RepID=A0ABR1IWT5_9AGAR